ncbi:MAG: hypothetical protein U9R06_00425 [Patescibacteria group bacterium]|nr:hypothetical protein [Patescibacteria group bacterium]
MDIEIDLTPIYEFMNLPTNVMIERFLYLFGWIPIAITFLWGVKELWIFYIQNQFFKKNFRFTLLAIDVPRGNMQSPKAVENIFTYVQGAHGTFNLYDIYWEGKILPQFSFEIVSIDGYTQFIIYIEAKFRNLIESAIYSQYPDAEITEIDDYTENAPKRFPDEEYDLWGGEFIQANDPAYPIKTYQEFEHQFGEPEVHFKDPMATLMDLGSSLRIGEQFWLQIIVMPKDFTEMNIADKEVGKILKEKISSSSLVDKLIDLPLSWLSMLGDIIFTTESEAKEEKEEDALRMMNLKPKEKKKLEALQNKAAKTSFDSKIRYIYLAKKEMFNKPKAVNGIVGYLKQFADLDLNNLKPDMKKTVTSTDYFFAERRLNRRKNNIMFNYVNRGLSAGKTPGNLNIEEMATLWHLPVESVVKAPLIQKAPGRKSEPPISLPVGEENIGETVFEDFAGNKELDEIFKLDEDGKRVEKSTGENNNQNKKNTKHEKAQAEDIFIEPRNNAEKREPPQNLPFLP